MDHQNSQSASYAAAGVDITAGYKAVELLKTHIARTRNAGCLDDVGGFGGCFGLPVAGMEEPVLVTFQTKIKSPFLRVLLANSITLTPGTITVSLEDDTYVVHALDKDFAEGIENSVFVRMLEKAERIGKKDE